MLSFMVIPHYFHILKTTVPEKSMFINCQIQFSIQKMNLSCHKNIHNMLDRVYFMLYMYGIWYRSSSCSEDVFFGKHFVELDRKALNCSYMQTHKLWNQLFTFWKLTRKILRYFVFHNKSEELLKRASFLLLFVFVSFLLQVLCQLLYNPSEFLNRYKFTEFLLELIDKNQSQPNMCDRFDAMCSDEKFNVLLRQ